MKSIVAQEIAKMGGAVPFAFEVTFADATKAVFGHFQTVVFVR